MTLEIEYICVTELSESGIPQIVIEDFRKSHETTGKHLSNDPRWPRVVNEYSGAKQFNWIVVKGNQILEIGGGNLFAISRFGAKTFVVGAFLDHGQSIYSTNARWNIENSQSKILENLKSKKMITKVFDSENKSLRSQSILFVKDLNEAEFLQQISSRARNDIKRAKRAGVTIDFNISYLDEFYKLYKKRMYEFGTPPHSLRFFEVIFKYFPNEAYVGVAKLDGKVVASSFGLIVDKQLFHLFASIDSEYRQENPGDLLLFEEIVRGLAMSVEEIWLGRSKSGSSVEFYKTKWAPTVFSTIELSLSVRGVWERIEHVEKQDFTAEVFKRLPRTMFYSIGSSLRKLIP